MRGGWIPGNDVLPLTQYNNLIKLYTSGGNVARWNRTARLKCEKIVLWHWIAGSNREERFRERDLDREQERETDTET